VGPFLTGDSTLVIGLAEFGDKNIAERLSHYRKFLYEKGEISGIAKEQARDFKLNEWKRLLKDAGASPVWNSASFILAHAPLRLLTNSKPNDKLRSAFAFCGAPGSGIAPGISSIAASWGAGSLWTRRPSPTDSFALDQRS